MRLIDYLACECIICVYTSFLQSQRASQWMLSTNWLKFSLDGCNCQDYERHPLLTMSVFEVANFGNEFLIKNVLELKTLVCSVNCAARGRGGGGGLGGRQWRHITWYLCSSVGVEHLTLLVQYLWETEELHVATLSNIVEHGCSTVVL